MASVGFRNIEKAYGTVKVIQNAAIAYGARVMVDSTAMTKVKTVPGTTGTYRSIGVKVSQGGGNFIDGAQGPAVRGGVVAHD